MLRPGPDAKRIELVARKTGANVFVPIHFEYGEVLKATKADHARLHLQEDGEAWTVGGFRTAWQQELSYGADHLAPRKGMKKPP
jgi:hypothetical protein